MASWEKWMPELVLAAPKAPVPLIHLALNRAARSFLKATRAWQEWLEPTDVTGEVFSEYTFELPQGAELLRLERATLNARPLDVANARDLPADPRTSELRGKAYLVTTNLREFTVRTGGAGKLQVYASLVLSLRGNILPDEVGTLYHEAIREGAKAELLNTEGSDYYKPDQAGVALAFFQRAIDDATTDVWRSNTSRGSRGRTSWL